MILVTKPCPPERLDVGVARTREDCAAYDAHGIDYQEGTRTFIFKKNIYGHHTVKGVLRDAQHGKCCYCEGRFDAYAAADIEHYRPKGAARQDDNSPTLRPGYYWLAYSWENLYWCCQVCNRSHKKDFFPLANPALRARSHTGNVTQEKPLLLDPGATENPRTHIEFRQERAIGLTEAGRKTIHVVGLNRPALIEDRRSHLRHLHFMQDVVQLCTGSRNPDGIDLLEDARRELADAVLSQAVFSAMASDLLRGEPVQTEAP